MRRVEHKHNTPEQVREYITGALELLGELELDDDLRVPVFLKAVELLAGKQITFEQIMPGGVDLTGVRHHG